MIFTVFRLVLFLPIASIVPTDGLVCYDCNNMVDTGSCKTTTTCASDQSCFMDRITGGNTTLFTLGCTSNKQCGTNAGSGTTIIGRSLIVRQDQRCHECCSTDNCAVQLCSHQAPTACVDDESFDCARLNTVLNICSDVSHAKNVCPHFCGLCNVVDGKWSSWNTWTNCSVTCDTGTQVRSRTCDNPTPAHGGEDCHGNTTEVKQCVRELCPVHGGWNGWLQWGACSVTCGVGIQRRLRDCTNPPPSRFGDHCFGVNLDDRLCFPGRGCTDGAWSGWNEWSNCSSASGCSGVKTRSRFCSNPYPSSYGKYCIGNPMEISSCISSNCRYRDCMEIKSSMGTSARTGLHNIYLRQSKKEVEVYCDMDTTGGGWTVFQRRFIGLVDFYRNFDAYEVGFGPVNGEFWLGLKTIHELTSLGRSELRIDLTAADGSHVYELFQNFSLSPGRNYTLQIDKGTGTAGDSGTGLSYHNGQNFATKDNDNQHRCANLSHGGWWYWNCANANLNGYYEVPGT